MIEIGKYNELKILRKREPGLFLGDEDGGEVLLPNRYVPSEYTEGDMLKVFVYLDNEERPVATTDTPLITPGDFAVLRCNQVNKFGAFLDFGLVKELFCPFKEQAFRMKAGQWYLVYCYLDEDSGRLVASSKTNRFLSNENLTVKTFDTVDIIISHPAEIGMNVIVNKKHLGLIHERDIYRQLNVGDEFKGIVKKVRPDNKLDIVLDQIGYKSIEPNADRVMELLKKNDGYLNLNDKSSPETIKDKLQMSKKSFKKAIGHLYKAKLIAIEEDGISLK
ncbi:MAG: GntR family transcriptional regulator [Flavobacteriaceae bacterium]|nr:GntR family transcriptional regulator [Bacteroidia bacterium]NNF76019.1 GntR family transcriptional regulator [Flavobacteriaceae bacterium]NNK72266.1 GntR family transcriptional regulator [Flavobacteriaceae bacterium]